MADRELEETDMNIEESVRRLEAAADGQRCFVCGCTESSPCAEGCGWAEENFCSNCYARLSDDLASLRDEPPIHLEVNRLSAWMLMAQLQLALRHPENDGPCADAARDFAVSLQKAVAMTPTLRAVAERGWDPNYDLPAGG